MKIHKLIPLLCLAFAFTACHDDDAETVLEVNGNVSDITAEYGLNFDKYGAPVPNDPEYSDDFLIFTVKSNVSPTVKVDDNWVHVEYAKTEKQVHTYNVTVEPNKSNDSRTTKIRVFAGDQQNSIIVSQARGRFSESNGMTALDIAKEMKAGINIGNTLEAPDGETSWGQPLVNEYYIQGLKDAGFNAVRIPVAWNSHAKDGVIKEEWLNRVDSVVGYVIDAGMYAIVNCHWDGGWLEENITWAAQQGVNDLQKKYWTQIANKLADYDEHLLFAATNEPNAIKDGDNEWDRKDKIDILVDYQKTMIDAVRATGGINAVRTIIVQGPNTNIDQTLQYYYLPEDSANDRLMVEVHYYDPYQFCLMEEDQSWGKVQWFWGTGNLVSGSDRNAKSGEADMQAQFAKMKERYVDNGIPVILGEYGAYPNEHYTSLQTLEDQNAILKSRVAYYNCVNKYGLSAGIIPYAWDTGELVSRYGGSVLVPEIVNAIISGAASATSPY